MLLLVTLLIRFTSNPYGLMSLTELVVHLG